MPGALDPWCFEVCPPTGDAWLLSVSAANDRSDLPPHPTILDALCTYTAPNTAYPPVYLGREPVVYSLVAVGYVVLVLRGHWIVVKAGCARRSAHFWMDELVYWVRAARYLAPHNGERERTHIIISGLVAEPLLVRTGYALGDHQQARRRVLLSHDGRHIALIGHMTALDLGM